MKVSASRQFTPGVVLVVLVVFSAWLGWLAWEGSDHAVMPLQGVGCAAIGLGFFVLWIGAARGEARLGQLGLALSLGGTGMIAGARTPVLGFGALCLAYLALLAAYRRAGR